MSYFVYILESVKSGRYYIGSCSNLQNRIKEHNCGENISTKNKGPWGLKFSAEYQSLIQARREERKLKSFKSHNYIEQIIKRRQLI